MPQRHNRGRFARLAFRMQHASRDDRLTWCGLFGALVLVVLVRTWVPYGEVFQNGDVVLAANDPYAFRYFVDRLLESGLSPIRPGDLAAIPDSIANHDVTFIVTMWVAAVLLGGSAYAGGVVLAVYPVIAAVLIASMIYLVTVWVTEDRRIGLLAVILLALTPAHAYRTMLGFGDHDAFGYVAVMLTVTGLVWLNRADANRRQIDSWYLGAIVIAGGGLAAASLGWRGGPILLAPVAMFVVLSVVLCLKHGKEPYRMHQGVLLAVACGAVFGGVLHYGLGWGQIHRGLAPMFLLVLAVAVMSLGEGVKQIGIPWPFAFVGVGAIAGGWFVGLATGPERFAAPMDRFYAFSSGPDSDVGERVSLIASLDLPIFMFGLLLLIAIPVMLWILIDLWDDYDPNWLLISSYAWGFLILASFRYRWSGLAAMFVVIFGAIAILALAAWMNVVRPVDILSPVSTTPIARRRLRSGAEIGRSVLVVGVLVILVMGTGVAQVPATMNTLTHDDELFETASFVAEYTAEHEIDPDEVYVFTEWGSNRAFNYHVHGDSRSYGYARSNYREFVSSADAERWHDRLDDRAAFVVIQHTQFAYPEDSMQVRLYNDAGDSVQGYRLIYANDDGSIQVYEIVEKDEA